MNKDLSTLLSLIWEFWPALSVAVVFLFICIASVVVPIKQYFERRAYIRSIKEKE